MLFAYTPYGRGITRLQAKRMYMVGYYLWMLVLPLRSAYLLACLGSSPGPGCVHNFGDKRELFYGILIFCLERGFI
jgi:hypothetical protein